jgi:hypothetical protein
MIRLLQSMRGVQSQVADAEITDIENGNSKTLKKLVEPYLEANFNLCKWIDEEELDNDTIYETIDKRSNQQMFVFIKGRAIQQQQSRGLFGSIVVVNRDVAVIFERNNSEKSDDEKKILDKIKFALFAKNKTVTQFYFDPMEEVESNYKVFRKWRCILTLSFLALQNSQGCLLYNFCASQSKSSLFNELVMGLCTADNFEVESISGPRMNTLVNMLSTVILDAMKANIWTEKIMYFDPRRLD